MNRYRMIIAYDGTHYSGWQIQPNAPSIQQTLERALSKIAGHPLRIHGSGRTDAGVHALGQCAHVDLKIDISSEGLLRALNNHLPREIRIMEIQKVSQTFHAQYSAIGKIYHYHIWDQRYVSPFDRLYRQHIPYQLDRSLILEGCSYFIGTHDFKSFANIGSGVKSTIRTLSRLDLVPQEGGFRLEFEGNGFLYKMVRNIVGTLIEVGRKKILLSEIPLLFEAKDRRAAGPSIGPQGLFLVQVHYSSAVKEGTYSKGAENSLKRASLC